MDSFDDMRQLGGYLGEFSTRGNLPTSLEAAAPTPAPEKRAPYVPVLEKAGVRYVSTPVKTVQTYLNLLQANAGVSGRLDAKTKAAFTKWAKLFKSPQTTLSAVKMEDVNSLERTMAKRLKLNPGFTYMDPSVLSRLGTLANKAASAGAKAPAPTKATPSSTAGTDMTANTHDIQGILKRLGAPKERLSDGQFGATTKSYWRAAAQKRSKNPSIVVKSGTRLSQVLVNTAAYLAIKADADAKTPPSPGTQEAEPLGGSLKTMDQTLVQGVTQQELELLVERLVPGVQKAMPGYEIAAKRLSVDPRIEADGDRFLVLKASLKALTEAFLATPPRGGVATPSRQANIETAKKSLALKATSGIPFATLQIASVAAVKLGEISSALGPQSTIMSMLIKLANPADLVWKEAWEQTLGPLLVAKKGVKVLPRMAKIINQLASGYRQAKTAAKERFTNYTKVNSAEVIARINGLGVTTEKFDRSGGAKELADAIRTFLTESKSSVPSGDLVRTDAQKNTYVRNGVMQALATAVSSAQSRAGSTSTFRRSMVANAIKESSTTLPVTSLQQAIRHLVLAKRAGGNTALYSKVRVTGAFDAPTRAAYTEMARTRTVGPAIQTYQAMLKKQLGPSFKVSLVVEARNQVWNAFLDEAVKKREGKLTVAMIPAIGVALGSAAALYQKNVAADTRHAEQGKAQVAALATAMKKSTAVVSILLAQQGLRQMMATTEIDAVSGLRITGVADKATNDALHETSGMIFPEGYVVPETIWAKYLRTSGFVINSKQTPVRSWIGANYLSVPPALADLLARRAGEWISKNGQSPVKIVKFNSPSVVTVKMPPAKEVVITAREAAKKLVESPAPTAKTGDAEQAAALKAARVASDKDRAARQLVELAAKKAKHAAELAAQRAKSEMEAATTAAAAAAKSKEVEHAASLAEQKAKQAGDARAAEQAAAARQQAALLAASQEAEAKAAQGRAMQASSEQQAAESRSQGGGGGGAQITGPSIQGPTINITSPAPAAASSGIGLKTVVGLVGGVVALVALVNKDSA